MPVRPRTRRFSTVSRRRGVGGYRTHGSPAHKAYTHNSWWRNKGGRSYYYGRTSKPYIPRKHRGAYRRSRIASFFRNLFR